MDSGGWLTATEQAWLEALRVTADSIHSPPSVQSPFHWLHSNNTAVKFLTQSSYKSFVANLEKHIYLKKK